jgi:hypothetical protein
MKEMIWSPDSLRPDLYERLNGSSKMLVRTQPWPRTGRYLWQYGFAYDWADTLEEAREMVEGLALFEGEPK